MVYAWSVTELLGILCRDRAYQAHLIIDDCDDVGALDAVVDKFAEVKELKELIITNRENGRLPPAVAQCIAKGLSVNNSIEMITLAQCLHKDAAVELLNGLSENKGVRRLMIITLGNEVGVTCAHMLRTNTTLKELMCTLLSLDDIIPVAKGICVNKGLKQLEVYTPLEGAQLPEGDKACRVLGQMLGENKCLVKAFFQISPSLGWEHIWHGLAMNVELQYLDFISSPVGNVEGLRDALILNKTLVSIGLNMCGLGDEAAGFLAQVLEQPDTTLQAISLGSNSIEENGLRRLLDALENNTVLTDFRIGTNVVHVTEKTFQGLLRNKNLKLFKISLAGEDLRKISGMLQVNTGIKILEVYVENPSLADTLFLLQCIRDNTSSSVGKLKMEYSFPNNAVRNLVENFNSEREALILKRFNNTWGSDQTAPWKRSKLMLIGEGKAGKSATVRSLLHLPFRESWNSTIGISLTEVETGQQGKKWKPDKLKNLSRLLAQRIISASIRTEAQTEPMKKRKGAQEEEELPVFSSQKKQSHSRKSVGSKRPTSQQQRETTAREGQKGTEEISENDELELLQSIKRYDMDMYCDSPSKSQDPLRVSIWDFGGQNVFHTLHHLFLTEYGVYLLVFDMAQLLREQNVDNLSFWINSVRMHVGTTPVILVGTFWDNLEPTQSLEDVENALSEGLGDLLDTCSKSETSDISFMPVSNRSGAGVLELREFVEAVTESQEFINKQINIKWVRCLDMLLDTTQPWVSLNLFRSSVAKIGVTDSLEVESMLSLFHELGVTLYFTGTEALREIIVTSPQWLMSAMSLIIRDKDLHDYDWEVLQKSGLAEEMQGFLDSGVVTRDLLELLWHETGQVQFLVDLMNQLLLMSDWSFANNDEAYLIPSMVTLPYLSDAPTKVTREEAHVVFSVLMDGIFERLVCLLIDYVQHVQQAEEQPRLYANHCILHFGGKLGHVHLEKAVALNSVILEVELVDTCSLVVKLINSMLQKIKSDLKLRSPFKWSIMVQHNDVLCDLTDLPETSHWKSKQHLGEVLVDLDLFQSNMM